MHNGNASMNAGPYITPLEIPSVPVRAAMPVPFSSSRNTHSNSATPLGDQYRSHQSYHTPTGTAYGPLPHLNRSNSERQYYNEVNGRRYDSANPSRNVAHQTFETNHGPESIEPLASARCSKPLNTSPRAVRSSLQPSTSPTQYRTAHASSYSTSPSQKYSSRPASGGNANNSYMPHQNFPPLATLPPPQFPIMSHVSPTGSHHSYSNTSTVVGTSEPPSGIGISGRDTHDPGLVDESGAPYTMPVFGGEGYSRSPLGTADYFTADYFALLIGDPHYNPASPGGHHHLDSMSIGQTAFAEHSDGNFQAPNGHGPTIAQQHPMAVTSILDPALPQTILSEDKRQQVLDLIGMRFNETDHAVREQKEALFDGDHTDDNHVLSLRMMQNYIRSYWYHFHPQMPILHEPTFSADKAQNLLLIAVIALGASCLDNKEHGSAITQAGADLSNFLAWHLRGEIFMDADFRPPAKLWVFQTLLLLEVYEKMYSTRVLHERAHIHHATTLTLMRRGSSLMGRSAFDSHPSLKDERGRPHTNGLQHAAVADTPGQWWNQWITTEATRRVAFAAFVIDSIHATSFGHKADMLAHEMRLPLPCDETLWSATSGVEVGRIEASLQAGGIKPISFLDGLRRTLNGQTVRTNSFGRTALMAGLLSVRWHMHQRDEQARSLGVTLGGKDIWRGSLTRAFDFWKSEFDSSVAKGGPSSSFTHSHLPHGRLDEENIFESRTVLHNLAHMAMHVDIVQCQIFAKATRLLGRTITPSDYNSAQRKIRDIWAPKASARDATFFALRFLSQVLTPDIFAGSTASSDARGVVEYSARDDFLLNRPWVLYFAALIVWSYGYARDGPLRQPVALSTAEEQTRDMRVFLKRVGGVKAPEDLASLEDRNACMGLLMLLRDQFRKCRWELMHEAASLLGNCIDMLKGNS